MSEEIGERHASACRYKNEVPEGSRRSARRTHFWPREALWNPFRVRVQTGYQPGAAFIRIRGFPCPRLICASLSGSVAAPTEPSHLMHKYYRALRNGGLWGELSLLVSLNHCDSAQRASGSQPGATPGNAPGFHGSNTFCPERQHRPALWNPFRVRVPTGHQPGAAFIRIRGFSCPRLRCASLSGSVAHHSHKSHKSHRPPRLICASLSGSIAALTSSINANTLNARVTEHSRPAKQRISA